MEITLEGSHLVTSNLSLIETEMEAVVSKNKTRVNIVGASGSKATDSRGAIFFPVGTDPAVMVEFYKEG